MEKIGEEVSFLIAQVGPLNGQRWALRKSMLLGRDPSCDIVIPSRQVSRHHVRLTISHDNQVIIEDLGSKNGTHCNGEPIDHALALKDGDVIQVALAQQFVFLSSDATVPLGKKDAELLDLPLGETAIAIPEILTRLRLDKRSRRVWVAPQQGERSSPEAEILPPLSASQFRLLEALYNSPGRVVPRQDLVILVWGESQALDISEQALDALVRRLRERIASVDPDHSFIITVRGHGLRLDNPHRE